MKDRGMMKWKAFVSIVEQQQAIEEVLNELSKIEKPLLDEWQHEQNSNLVVEGFLNQTTITLVYFERGQLLRVKGNVEKINEAYRYFILSDGHQRKKISFSSFVEVKG